MAVNDKIRKVDYNDIRAKIIQIIGTSGTGANATYGYGQRIESAAVSESTKVGLTEYTKLRTDINNIFIHQEGRSATSVELPFPVVGNTVRFDANTEPNSQWDDIANQLQTNRFRISTSYRTIETNAAWTKSRNFGGSGGVASTPWKVKAECRITCSWTSSQAARQFFNSGGTINFASSRSGGTTTGGTSTIAAQNNNWTSLLSTAGTQSWGGNLPTAGTGGIDGQNFYRCDDQDRLWVENVGSGDYSTNDWSLYAQTPGVTNSSTGTASTVEFLCEWKDDHVPKGSSTLDGVDGTLSVTVTVTKPDQQLLPTGSGAWTVETPTITISNITAT